MENMTDNNILFYDPATGKLSTSRPENDRLQSSAGQEKYQWYSGSGENRTFEKILNDFMRIAYQGQVELTRDKTT